MSNLKYVKTSQDCVICLRETEFSNNTCTECGNEQIGAIIDRNEAIEALSSKNKMMMEALSILGYSDDDITSISNGLKVPVSLSQDTLKDYAVKSYMSNCNDALKEYDMLLSNSSTLSKYQPFENWSDSDIVEVIDNELDNLILMLQPKCVLRENENLEGVQMYKCISCKIKMAEGYTWENKTHAACSNSCLLKSGLTQSEINSDINAGVIYWDVLETKPLEKV